MFQKILVAIDRSQISQHVFDEAISLAKAESANLMLLHVLSPVDVTYLHPVGVNGSNFYPILHSQNIDYYMMAWEEQKQAGLKFLKEYCNQAIKLGVVTEFTQNVGDAGKVICEVARTWEANLIIMGRRGRNGLSELFLGSVSNYVLHHAPCSVLTVQGQITAKTEEAADSMILLK
jgi:nucleotide-binding universal stress UspA family protein